MNNLALLSDSYKYSHFNQYPDNIEYVFSYLESRGGGYDEDQELVFFGLQYFIKEYINKAVTEKDVQELRRVSLFHGIPFNEEGWDYILKKCNGFLPLLISAVPEGTVCKPGEVLMTITNTDPNCHWVTNWAETLLLKVWYPITVASKARHVRNIITKHWLRTCDNLDGVDFAYHNFGDRGSSSVESAMLGGMAHLTQFLGTDNFNAVKACETYYGQLRGHSIPASEHSTVTSWGKDNEMEMVENYLESNRGQPIIACVMDSYNIYDAVNKVTSGDFLKKIESPDYPTFVIRPDSGDPIEVLERITDIMLDNGVKFHANDKGYIVFDKYRIIWGDGINPFTIDKILDRMTALRYSAENFAFGSGGNLMQEVNRDTFEFAIKCSAACVDGTWRDVYKDPVTAKGKASKRGILNGGKLVTVYDKWPISGYDDLNEISARSREGYDSGETRDKVANL